MRPKPLTGQTIAVTRPRAQAEALAVTIAAQGGTPFLFPLLEIGPASDPAPLMAAAATLETFALAIFVSPNAVRYALPVLRADKPWPAQLQALAVGSGTAGALAEAGGIPCLAPAEHSGSESLLTLPELASARIADKRVALFRGNGGRELLAKTLTARKARVTEVPCYQRDGPKTGIADFLRQLAAGNLDALTLSSSEALRYLLQLSATPDFQAAVRALPLFVAHPRIADKAKATGFQHVILTAPTDEGLLTGLCAYNWTYHE
jgi:uroporphyrinogen-III synthase